MVKRASGDNAKHHAIGDLASLAAQRELAEKMAELERKLEGHDHAIRNLFEAVRKLLNPPAPPRKQADLRVEEGKGRYNVRAKRKQTDE